MRDAAPPKAAGVALPGHSVNAGHGCLRLRSGRAFTRLDGAESPPVLMVNETLARELFGGEPAVGQRLLPAGAVPEPWEVIGVVAGRGRCPIQWLGYHRWQAEAYMPLH